MWVDLHFKNFQSPKQTREVWMSLSPAAFAQCWDYHMTFRSECHIWAPPAIWLLSNTHSMFWQSVREDATRMWLEASVTCSTPTADEIHRLIMNTTPCRHSLLSSPQSPSEALISWTYIRPPPCDPNLPHTIQAHLNLSCFLMRSI